MKNFYRCISIAMLAATAVLFGCEEKEKYTPESDQNAFEFTNVVANHTSAKLNVLPKDKNMEYIVLFSEKQYFDDSREKLVESDYLYLKNLAKNYNLELRELLLKMECLVQGDKMEYEVINLYPDTDYVAYCYGVAFDEESYKATTEIYYEVVKTTAPEMKQVEFDINTQGDGDAVTFYIDPKGYEDYYYAYIVPDTDEYYLPKGAEFEASYVKHYRNKTIDEFRKSGDEFATTFDNFCHKGVETFEKRLEPNKKYMLIAFAVSEDQEPLLCSVPEPHYFSTGDVIKSDLVVDIKVTDITAYEAQLTLTPSNNDEEYACVFISKEQMPVSEDKYEQMLSIIENFQPAIFKGVHAEALAPLTPQSEYVVLAFGIDNDLPTTDLFRYDFTSKEGEAGKITVESINLVKLFDSNAIIELDNSYAEALAESECVAVVEMKTSIPTDKIRFWWYEEWMKEEYNDVGFLEDLLMYEYSKKPELMPMYYSTSEEDLFFFAGIAEDDMGNLSQLYKSESFTLSAENCAPAEEFFDYTTTQSANTFIFAVDRKSLGRR